MRAPIFLLICAYALSLVLAPRATIPDQVFYLISIGSNFVLFYIAYTFAKNAKEPNTILNVLVLLNIIVILYCYLQLVIGFERFAFFGIEEFTIHQNRLDQRLSGPFNAVGITAEYLAIQILLLAYLLLHELKKRRKLLLYGLIAANFAFLTATGNRGGLISLIIGGFIFLYLYRRELGLFKVASIGLIAAVTFFFVSVLVIAYTPFNRLYERLADTTFEGGIPDTRAVTWPLAWQEIKQKPILGHGPRFQLHDADKRVIPGHKPLPFPHNLYLFILYTLGLVGLLAYLVFLASIFWKLRKANRMPCRDPVLAGIPRLGALVMIVFLIDQIKVEFLRYHLSDYQHYVFMLWGLFVGFSDWIIGTKTVTASSVTER